MKRPGQERIFIQAEDGTFRERAPARARGLRELRGPLYGAAVAVIFVVVCRVYLAVDPQGDAALAARGLGRLARFMAVMLAALSLMADAYAPVRRGARTAEPTRTLLVVGLAAASLVGWGAVTSASLSLALLVAAAGWFSLRRAGPRRRDFEGLVQEE